MSRVSPNNAGREGYSSGAPLVEAEAELGPDAAEEVEQMRSAEKKFGRILAHPTRRRTRMTIRFDHVASRL